MLTVWSITPLSSERAAMGVQHPALYSPRRCSSIDRLKPKRSLAPGPCVASLEIQGASAGPSQTFSVLPCFVHHSNYRAPKTPSYVRDRGSAFGELKQPPHSFLELCSYLLFVYLRSSGRFHTPSRDFLSAVKLHLAHRLLDRLAWRRLLLLVGHAGDVQLGVRHLVGDRLVGKRSAEQL